MKLIHTADLHLGSKLDSVFSRELAKRRKNELISSFERMIAYAEANGVSAILLSGDVFDSDTPLRKDKSFFFDAIKAHPDIDFLYLAGNHDKADSTEEIANLKCFSSEWRQYAYGDIVISGIELVADNASSYYNTLSLEADKTNIVMLHGQVGDSVNLVKLRDKHIDYLALGHIHSYAEHPLDSRGVAVYSGCLEGRGFDETGEKGFVLLEIEDTVRYRFIPFSREPIYKKTVDISGIAAFYDIVQTIRGVIEKQDAIYRVELVGRTELDELTEESLEQMLAGSCAFVSVKNNARRTINIADYEGDLSIRGEFVRAVMASDYSEDDKTEIILYGLKALSGEEVQS